jgi:hypothetical protein
MSMALRQGRSVTAPDGMIAAIARINGGRLAILNLPDFATTGLELMSVGFLRQFVGRLSRA